MCISCVQVADIATGKKAERGFPMKNKERFSLLIVALVVSFATGAAVFAVALPLAALVHNPNPLLVALRGAAMVVGVTFGVTLFMHGAHYLEHRGDGQ